MTFLVVISGDSNFCLMTIFLALTTVRLRCRFQIFDILMKFTLLLAWLIHVVMCTVFGDGFFFLSLWIVWDCVRFLQTLFCMTSEILGVCCSNTKYKVLWGVVWILRGVFFVCMCQISSFWMLHNSCHTRSRYIYRAWGKMFLKCTVLGKTKSLWIFASLFHLDWL